MIVEKIYHLADLHIRNLKRHNEYRQVFQKFLDRVDTDNIQNSVIYLAGDIAHAKTEMSPELIREISWFLTECSNRRETILITGNHDCNLNNNYRLDVLTPIIHNLSNPHIHYLRDTGVYNIHNLTFVVYSILDKKENWPKAESVEAENKICLFHGPVNLAQTDIGYTVSSNSFTVDMFDGFDMVMLGDIHKRQNFGFGYEHIAYAGSMVQQNHGESLNTHGYLLWDVKSRTYEGFDIENDYGFYTLDVVNGVVPQVTDMPAKPRLRVRITNTDPTQIKRALTEIQKQYKVEEFTVTRMDTISKQKQGNYDDKLSIGNVRDIEFQNGLIRDYLERQFLADEETVDKIQQINREINTKLVDEDSSANIQWIPKEFEFHNMFSYGENNKIRFDNAKGMVGIFAPNASGKSSLFDALSFCIFDKTSRTYIAKNILNNRKTEFGCKFHFQIDGVDYFIERVGKVINKGKNVKVDVDFWKEEGGVVTSLNGEQRRDTNSIIQNYLGTYDDFVLTSLSLQGNNALFIDKSQSERKDILAQFMGVDVFDKLYNIASEENRDNASLIKKFKSDDFTTKLADIETKLIEKLSEYSEVENNLTDFNKSIDKLNQQLVSLNGKIVPIKSDEYTLEQLESKKTKLEDDLQSVVTQRDSNQSKITELEEKQIELEEYIDKFDEKELKINVKVLEESEAQFNKVENELEKIGIKLTSLEERKKHLDSHKYNENCDVCMENSKTILEQKEDVETQLLDIDSKIRGFLDERDAYQHTISEHLTYRDMSKQLFKQYYLQNWFESF